MKRKIAFFSFFFILFLNLVSSQEIKLKKVWEIKDVFKIPESVWYDSSSGYLFVSNINGNPLKKDGNGFISKVSIDGKLVKLKWIKGLNAPKGIFSTNGKLYFTDIDTVYKINIESGKILNKYYIEGSIFLNDIVGDSNGNIYITDSSTKNSSVYILNNGKVKFFLKGADIKNPNGLFFSKNKLFIGNSGREEIIIYDLKENKISKRLSVGEGVDGLILTKNSLIITSNWKGKTQALKLNGERFILLDTEKEKINAADIGYIASENLIVIPTFFKNSIVAYKIIKTRR